MYTLLFWGGLSSLAAWLVWSDRPQAGSLRYVFGAFLAGYTIYVLQSDLSWGTAAKAVSRDWLVWSAAAFLLKQVYRQFPKAFVPALGLILAAGWWFNWSLPSNSATMTAPASLSPMLDSNGELLVDLRDGLDPAGLLNGHWNQNITFTRAFYPADADFTDLDDYYVADLSNADPAAIQELVKAWTEAGIIDGWEYNEQVRLDPEESTNAVRPVQQDYGINDPGLPQLWGFESMEIAALYQTLQSMQPEPRKKALIAILDTGIDAKHEDIQDNYQSTASKYDNDPRGHGTHCAGIAAAVSNNNKGIASFSTDNSFVKVTSIKVLSASGMGTQQMIIAGMTEAADKGADVISMSLGGRSDDLKQRAYVSAVKYANRKGAIVVAAAGNENRNAKETSPANVDGVITVSAVDERLDKALFSNYISDVKMGIAAPGVNIYSTVPNSQYAIYSGTSMATPYVAGLVGLMKSLRPGITTKEVHQILKSTGKPTKQNELTGPLIVPHKAVEALLALD